MSSSPWTSTAVVTKLCKRGPEAGATRVFPKRPIRRRALSPGADPRLSRNLAPHVLCHGAQKLHQIFPNEGSSAKRPHTCVRPEWVDAMATCCGVPGMADTVWQSAQVMTAKHCMVTFHVCHSGMPSHMASSSPKMTFCKSRLRYSKCLDY